MAPVIERAPKELLGNMNKADLAEFIRLLELARKRSAELQAEESGEGRESS